jgi:hypothetical protein
MAKATITDIKPVKPEQKVTLVLSIKEAAVLQFIVGSVSQHGQLREVAAGIYFSLWNINRVNVYNNQIFKTVNRRGLKTFPVGNFDIPEEP